MECCTASLAAEKVTSDSGVTEIVVVTYPHATKSLPAVAQRQALDALESRNFEPAGFRQEGVAKLIRYERTSPILATALIA